MLFRFIFVFLHPHGGMVDASVWKTGVLGRAGSTPVAATWET